MDRMVAEVVRASHEALQNQVEELRAEVAERDRALAAAVEAQRQELRRVQAAVWVIAQLVAPGAGVSADDVAARFQQALNDLR